jgi:hypothetical protein
MPEYSLNFRCYYANGNFTDHSRVIPLSDIPKWIDSYLFTHPACVSISVKIWFDLKPF